MSFHRNDLAMRDNIKMVNGYCSCQIVMMSFKNAHKYVSVWPFKLNNHSRHANCDKSYFENFHSANIGILSGCRHFYLISNTSKLLYHSELGLDKASTYRIYLEVDSIERRSRKISNSTGTKTLAQNKYIMKRKTMRRGH